MDGVIFLLSYLLVFSSYFTLIAEHHESGAPHPFVDIMCVLCIEIVGSYNICFITPTLGALLIACLFLCLWL